MLKLDANRPADRSHDPVLIKPILELLAVKPGQTVIDCTLGLAGHGRWLAEAVGPAGTLVGLDVDPRNLAIARENLAPLKNFRLFHANFAELDDVADALARPPIHAILADLGISTNQLFDGHYGLSFAQPMPLDMRLDPRIKQSAADVVAQSSESSLADLMFYLAQERYSRRIARNIVAARRQAPITTTDRLAEIVRASIPRKPGPPERIDPATRAFMALRMHVNSEISNLQALLRLAPRLLCAGGRFAVISFHSTEDRLVKTAFRALEASGHFKTVTRKPVVPDENEMSVNPRSRSAKLRVVERLT